MHSPPYGNDTPYCPGGESRVPQGTGAGSRVCSAHLLCLLTAVSPLLRSCTLYRRFPFADPFFNPSLLFPLNQSGRQVTLLWTLGELGIGKLCSEMESANHMTRVSGI